MKESPFGILMINYNHGAYIGEAIGSVLCQSDKNWNLVVVDDGSTDDSLEIARCFEDERIQVIERVENGGMSAASKTGMEFLRTPIVGILDSDDVIEPSAVKVMREAWVDHPNASMLYSKHWKCRADLSKTEDLWQSAPLVLGQSFLESYNRGGILMPDGVSRGTVGPWRTFSLEAYKRTSGFDSRFKYSQDFDLTLKLEEVGDLVHVPERLYHYRFDLLRHRSYPNMMKQIATEAKLRRQIADYRKQTV